MYMEGAPGRQVNRQEEPRGYKGRQEGNGGKEVAPHVNQPCPPSAKIGGGAAAGSHWSRATGHWPLLTAHTAPVGVTGSCFALGIALALALALGLALARCSCLFLPVPGGRCLWPVAGLSFARAGNAHPRSGKNQPPTAHHRPRHRHRHRRAHKQQQRHGYPCGPHRSISSLVSGLWSLVYGLGPTSFCSSSYTHRISYIVRTCTHEDEHDDPSIHQSTIYPYRIHHLARARQGHLQLEADRRPVPLPCRNLPKQHPATCH
ncbi:hypothetical protein B0J11DRAFT_573508 [Dendryphion nanum]|uniref:Uncharacterized protein n=1 Tax=Dendryphion nanum TaxID=256645 RepID=A0A9P9D0S8_9PLEO|nr:hypothetical protein B0J11DRAFT_573508 [Dendryphion nanum]